MAEWTRRDVTTTRREYVLPNPTNWGAVEGIFAVLKAELGDRGEWDNTVTVEGRDDELVISYELPEEASHA